MSNALGIIEWRGIARGIVATDLMLKAATVELAFSGALCPGKYISIVTGDVGSVRNSVRAAVDKDEENVVDSLVLGNVHPMIIPALTGTAVAPAGRGAFGIVETLATTAAVQAGDVAVKSSQVELVEIRLARCLGGKSVTFIQGEITAVKNALQQVTATLDSGLLIAVEVVSSMHKSLWEKIC